MDNPIKVIYKYKNNNRRIQYHMYIFIGDIVPSNIMSLLKRIQDKSFYQSLTELSKIDEQKLSKHYGPYWYKKFFNSRHINKEIGQINKNKQKQDELIKKFGQDWYNKHIKEFKLIDKKIYYSYATSIKEEKIRKEVKKRKLKIKEDEEELDYTTNKNEEIKNLSKETMIGSSYS